MIKMKKKLFLDFDGVIVDTVSAIVGLYSDDFRYYKSYRLINPEEIDTWNFEELNCATPDYINTYFNQPRFFKNLKYIDSNIFSCLRQIKEYYDITVVTTGYSPNLVQKSDWIITHLFDFVGDIELINLKEYKNKSHIDMSGGVFVDDSYSNLADNNAERCICYGKVHGWNKDWKGERAEDWATLTEKLLKGV